ncbi:hypothetical protein Btru_066204 [Bulinus truncatus]|nr:hypothetical protein Btru_066204 [Bulinus truncatus]
MMIVNIDWICVAGPVAVTVAEPVAVTLAVPQIGPEAVPRNEPVAVPVQAAVPKAGQLSVPKAGPESHVQLADIYMILKKWKDRILPDMKNAVKTLAIKNSFPIQKLSMKHLPKGHHDELLLNCIRAVSNLTVKIEVKYKVVGKVRVLTSRHVVFDKSEAVITNCKLNYNSESEKVLTIPAIDVDESEYGTDLCELTCVTCDADLFKILMVSTINCSIHRKKLHENFNFPKEKNFSFYCITSSWYAQTSQFWISKKWEYKLSQHSVYTYDTPTCPGSSGALVNIVQQTPNKYHLYNSHVHSEG